eukprot:5018094-Amphidinium_carterae.4
MSTKSKPTKQCRREENSKPQNDRPGRPTTKPHKKRRRYKNSKTTETLGNSKPPETLSKLKTTQTTQNLNGSSPMHQLKLQRVHISLLHTYFALRDSATVPHYTQRNVHQVRPFKVPHHRASTTHV